MKQKVVVTKEQQNFTDHWSESVSDNGSMAHQNERTNSENNHGGVS